MKPLRNTAVLLAFITFASLAHAQPKPAPKPPADVVFEPNITYGKAGDVELKLNLARPANHDDKAKPLPVVLVIHGGAWRAGHRDGHNPQVWQLAQRGYVAVTPSYRFCPQHVFPAQVEDVKCAVRWIRANAKKYNIDPQRIGAVGFSAGAHLSMMLGVMDKADGMEGDGGHAEQSSKVQAVVAFFGPTDMAATDLPAVSQGLVKDFLGGTPKEKPEMYRKASPVTYVDKDDAPILMIQGTKDPLVPHSQAFTMTDAMTKAGAKGRVDIIIGAGHGWAGKELERTFDITFKYLDEQLKK